MAYTTIDDPSAHFQTTLYTGNGSTLTVTNGGNSDLQPDMLWFKNRNDTQGHEIFDSIRGVASSLRPHDTDADVVDSPNDRLTAINSDGFTLGDDGNPNTDTNTYVCWQWKANGSGSANTDGDMAETVTVSVNTDAGFSIVTYTGDGSAATVGHGLSKAPEWIYIKRRSGADSWRLYHKDIGLNGSYPNFMQPDLTTAVNSGDSGNFTAAPSATLFSIGDYSVVNSDDDTYVAYCFHSVQGYSKFGSYTGNGDADGTFVYTGFKPAWLLTKQTDGVDNWQLVDHKRDPFNLVDAFFSPDRTSAENTHNNNIQVDFLSNGFKCRNTNSVFNGSGNDYIYMAFAESPFVTSGGVPCTAR